MPAVHMTEPERHALATWLERQDEAFRLPPEIRSGLRALQRECPHHRALTDTPPLLVHRVRAD